MKVNNYDNLEHIYRFDENNETKKEVSNDTNNALDKDAFLKLLVTQLANQNPLNPIEDKEFIAQLAQFSSLEQMQNLNKNVTELGEEIIHTIDHMHLNELRANAEILNELTVIREAIESYLNVGDEHLGEENIDEEHMGDE